MMSMTIDRYEHRQRENISVGVFPSLSLKKQRLTSQLYSDGRPYRPSPISRENDYVRMGKKIIAEKEAAEFLNLSVKTLQKWRYQGCGAVYHKFRKVLRYQQTELDEFANSSRIEPVR
jgi:hypothetical protein